MLTIAPCSSKQSSKTQSELSNLDFLDLQNKNIKSESFDELVENSDFSILSQKLFYEILKPWEPVFKVGQDPHYQTYDVYDTIFLKEGLNILKQTEGFQQGDDLGNSTSVPHTSNRSVSARTNSQNLPKACSSLNLVQNDDQTASSHQQAATRESRDRRPAEFREPVSQNLQPYLSPIIIEKPKEVNKKISKCNFTSRYKPNIRKCSANNNKNSSNRSNNFEIPQSFRHYVPVGSEMSPSNYLNWSTMPPGSPRASNSASRGSRKPGVMSFPRANLNSREDRRRALAGRNQPSNVVVSAQLSSSGLIGSQDNVPGQTSRPGTCEDLSVQAQTSSTITYSYGHAGYQSAKYKNNKLSSEIKKYKFKIFKHPQQFIDDYKLQVVQPELMEYNEKLQNLKYEKYRQNQQMLKAIPLVLDSRPSTPLMKMVVRNESLENRIQSKIEQEKVKNASEKANITFGVPRYPTISIPTRKNDGNSSAPQFLINGVSEQNKITSLNRPQMIPNTTQKYRSEQNWQKNVKMKYDFSSNSNLPSGSKKSIGLDQYSHFPINRPYKAPLRVRNKVKNKKDVSGIGQLIGTTALTVTSSNIKQVM